MNKLVEIAKVFSKLGSISFGGPAAHIAMMQDEIVRKRKWISQQHFLDLIGATNLIPGPNSTEMTMHCGYERAGWKGLFALLYQEYGQLPNVKPFIYGIKPAVISIIIMAAYKLGKKALKSVELGLLGLITIIIAVFAFKKLNSAFIVLFGAVAGYLLSLI